MTLKKFGYNHTIEAIMQENHLTGFSPARVLTEHKERYIVMTENGESEAEITGNLRYTAKSREDFPAVGDWVAIQAFDNMAFIHKVLPRFSLIARKMAGSIGEKQIIATNINYAFLLQALDRDYNISRLERYLTLVHSSEIIPVIVLTKTDLVQKERLSEMLSAIKQRIPGIQTIPVSNTTRSGYKELEKIIQEGKTYCMLGSSGVGKSTLTNNLSEKDLMKTEKISASTNKGKHITTHRELILIKKGALLIDTPGMREVGITEEIKGLETTFELIFRLATSCKYKDCSHTEEEGCAVIQAVQRGELDEKIYENYLKMERERSWFDSTLAEKRRKDKEFGKIVRNIKKMKNNRF